MGEGRSKSLGQTEKEFLSVSLYLDHPQSFFILCVPLSLSRKSATSIAESKAEEVSSCEESLSESTERELCQSCCFLDDFIQQGEEREGRAPLSLVSWMGASVFFRFIQDSLRSAFAYPVVAGGEHLCSNSCPDTIIYN